MGLSTSVHLTQSPAYPVVGQNVSLGATGVPAGRRIRWRLISTPPTSALELYTPRNELYLTDGQLAPDIEGRYILEAVEEEFVSHIPHFLGDTLNGHGPVEEWEEQGYEQKSVYVGCRMVRQLGVGQDQVTLACHCFDSDSEHGVLTAFYDQSLRSELSDPTSDKARLAMAARPVQIWLSAIGGKDYPGSSNYISTAGITGYLTNPYSSTYGTEILAKFLTSFGEHLKQVTSGTHKAADSDVVTAAAATDLASLLTLANQEKAKHNAHCARTPAVHAGGADSTYTVSSSNATDLASAITLLNEIRSDHESHRITGVVHYAYGDGSHGSRLIEPACWDLASAILLANDIRAKQIHHFGMESNRASAFHKNADTDNSVIATAFQFPTDEASLIYQINALADLLHAHAQNIKWSDKSSKEYHHVVDASTDLSRIARASNGQEAIALLEFLCFAINRHEAADGPHDFDGSTMTSADFYVDLLGIHRLNVEFLQAVYSQDLGSPATGLTSQQQLISFGGFEKG